MGTIERPLNNSKGCGAVMRVAPVGLLLDASVYGSAAFTLGCESGAITHGHPAGYLSSGFLAQVIAELVAGVSFETALQTSLEILADQPDHDETSACIQYALQAARDPDLPYAPETVEKIGAGWVGEEALAIGIYAALFGVKKNSFSEGVLLAVNHSGDCDSTAAIAGNLLGMILGKEAIPPEWLAVEMRKVIEELSEGLLAGEDLGEIRKKL